MYADISTEYKNYQCKVSSVQNKTAGEPCAQSVTKDGKKLILCRPYLILHWKHILFSAQDKTPLHDCLEENTTKFFCPLCCTSLWVKRHCVISWRKICLSFSVSLSSTPLGLRRHWVIAWKQIWLSFCVTYLVLRWGQDAIASLLERKCD